MFADGYGMGEQVRSWASGGQILHQTQQHCIYTGHTPSTAHTGNNTHTHTHTHSFTIYKKMNVFLYAWLLDTNKVAILENHFKMYVIEIINLVVFHVEVRSTVDH